MKIKSVKIAGFRAFQKEENSTFDFTKSDVIMNFTSIYAPNGYGKTSFYDAVEWGVTHKIQRFDRMVDFEKVRKDNNAPLLLNNASKSGKVVIETNNGVFQHVINNRKKYNYKAKAENDYFRDQILSQDLIDAFLKEEKADKRYENFLEIDENLKKYDLAYKKINILLGYINDQKKELNKKKDEEEKKLQGEFDFEEEFKKFDEINEVISVLIQKGEDLKLIDQNLFNETAHDNLSRNVNVRLSSLEAELNKAKFRIETIILARDGEKLENNRFNGGVFSYLENRSKITKLDNQLKELEKIVKWFEEKELLDNESNIIDENLKSRQNSLERALNIEMRFESFLNIQKEVDITQSKVADLKDIMLDASRYKIAIANKNNEIVFKLNELKKSLENNSSKLNNIPDKQKQLEITTKNIVELEKSITDLSASISTEEKKRNELKITLDKFGYYENKIYDDIELLLEFDLFKKHKEIVTNYISKELELEQLRKKIKSIQIKIDNHKQLNKELNAFINSGMELINKTQSSDCPLCNHSYGSIEMLSKSILSNKLLDSQLKNYLEEKAVTDSRINELIQQLSYDKEEITKVFTSIKEPYLSDYKTIQNKIDKFTSERKDTLEKLTNNQSILSDINSSLGDCKTFEELLSNLKLVQSQTEKQILELSNLIKKNDETILEKETLVRSTKAKLEISERNILKYESSNEYKQIREYFINVLNTNKIEKQVLSEKISSLNFIISDLRLKKENLKMSLEELKKKLSNYTLSKGEYLSKIKLLNETKNLIFRTYESFENYILSEFSIELKDKDKTQIKIAFLDLIEKQKSLASQAESKIKNYNILKILNDACIKATVYKKVQVRINEIINSAKELQNVEKKLIAEKESLKSYLKYTIESYFYTSLINSIYQKIDPHPDYKKIEFECDFGDNKPRLQIYTTTLDDNGKEIKSVPSLYFSTAQVNILSLSIFLARALKTKDDMGNSVDCIFIDDPIQSMDSINVLSFIDFFRGIITSLDKQLIVSTHEENFHLLLQKKIPIELFKSKYIEFETYGKLKTAEI